MDQAMYDRIFSYRRTGKKPDGGNLSEIQKKALSIESKGYVVEGGLLLYKDQFYRKKKV